MKKPNGIQMERKSEREARRERMADATVVSSVSGSRSMRVSRTSVVVDGGGGTDVTTDASGEERANREEQR